MSATGPASSLLGGEKTAVERALAQVLDRGLADVDPRLAEPIRYAVEAGGKRLRPVLCIAAYRAACGVDPAPEVYQAACALELIHTYSLLHDDLPCMDDDDFRRGRPTAHRVFGDRAAMLAGALMIPLAVTVLIESAERAGLPSVVARAAALDLMEGAGAMGMVGGQVMDLAAEGRTVSPSELEAIHLRKTGALIAASLRVGARLAQASAGVVAAFAECGRSLGLAFQVTDDVLDVTGQTATLGKIAGRDAEQRKATYPALLGLEGARAKARAEASGAVRALHSAGIHDELLEGLIAFSVSRDR